MRRPSVLLPLVAILLASASVAYASAEICGNGADEDADGVTDNGCDPMGVTGVCESPMDCGTLRVGMAKGALVFRPMTDINVTTPYGPRLTFQRLYTSMFDTGYTGGTATYKNPFGYRMQHNYLGWLTVTGSSPNRTVVVHMTTGQDALFSESGASNFVPAAGSGWHVQTFVQDAAAPNNFTLTMLDGQTFVYDSTSLKLIAIKDSVGNALTIAYSGGLISTVTDPTTVRQLQFAYNASNELQFVKFYANSSLVMFMEYSYTGDKLYQVKSGTVLPPSDNSTVMETYSYDNQGMLASIVDGEGTAKTVATFVFDSSTGLTQRRIQRIHTPQGDIGYTYSDAACTGGATGVYFNRFDTNTCTADGSGYYCGGKDPGQTPTSLGWKYRARRCVSFTTSKEDLVSAVTATCTSCLETKAYTWDTTTLRPTSRKSADDVYTSYLVNSDGVTTRQVEADTDTDASTIPSGARATYFFYGDSSYKGWSRSAGSRASYSPRHPSATAGRTPPTATAPSMPTPAASFTPRRSTAGPMTRPGRSRASTSRARTRETRRGESPSSRARVRWRTTSTTATSPPAVWAATT